MTNSTLSGNSASSSGGGIYRFSGTVRLRNSIVANSPAGGNCVVGPVQSQGNNLSDTAACFPTNAQKGDLANTPPLLGILAISAPGTTPMHALLPGSPAIDGVRVTPVECPSDTGQGGTVTTDQRGVPRPQAVGAARCDIGAFELEGTDRPTISGISPKSTKEDTPTSAIPFTVGDDTTPPADLVVTGASSNQSLVPSSNVVTSGSGASRGVTITPAANQSGTAEITLTVSDGLLPTSSTFILTVDAVNDPPVNSVPGEQTTVEDAPLVFSAGKDNLISVADLDTGSSPLQVALTATGGTVSLNGINGLTVASGENGSAGVTVRGTLATLNTALNGLTFTPAPNSTTTGSLQIVTSDLGATGVGGPLTDTDVVAIIIMAGNDPPTISAIGNQSIDEDTATTAISFSVHDQETAEVSLTVTAVSSNQSIVPNANVVLAGSGANRTATITPLPNQHGPVDITLTVGDGSETRSTTFSLSFVAVNDPPSNVVPGPQIVNQNASLVFTAGNGNLISLADIDAGSSNVRFALTATNGAVTLNGTAGLTVVAGANGTASVAVTGTLIDLNNALNGLRFTPTSGLSGTASLQVVTNDQGGTGSGGARSDADTITITVQPFHAAPTISSILDQGTDQNGSTPTIPFVVGSSEVPASSLVVTATSSNTTLVPSSGIQLSGGGAARAIRATAVSHRSGATTIDVMVSDGTATAHSTFQVTVLQVSQVPVAVNDSYSVGAAQALTVPAASGVLTNDTDADAGSLQAQLVSGPARGSLTLNPNGGLTYTPSASFAGTDSFTYRASDGTATSSPATVTITVVASRCAPRATVKVTTTVASGKLQAKVETLPLDGQTNNQLIELRFGAFQNGRVTVNGQPVASGATYTVPASTTQVVFLVERATAGQATTIPLTVVDECGAWPSFVGGGPGAGF